MRRRHVAKGCSYVVEGFTDEPSPTRVLVMAWVCAVSSQTIRAGAARRVDLDGKRIALFNVDGTFCAIEDECPHEEGGSLSKGTVEHGSVWCPLHGARFALATGQTLEPPEEEPMGPPVERGVRVYAVTLRGDDLYVDL